MRFFWALLFLSLSFNAFSQIGISAKYLNSSTKNWNNLISNASGSNDFLKSGLEFGVNYWFRLKNQRIEFLPEVVYSMRSQDYGTQSNPGFQSAKMNTIGFNTNVQIYPLDFYNDCNCPTFSKDGNIITKGFYWLISPGIAQVNKELSYLKPGTSDDELETIKSNKRIVAHIGIGAGLDIGIADLFTISPFIVYDFSFGHQWNEFTELLNVSDTKLLDTKISSLNLGLRLMFRPDYVKQNRGFRR